MAWIASTKARVSSPQAERTWFAVEMTRPQIRYQRTNSNLYIGAELLDRTAPFHWHAPLELITDCSLASLRQVLLVARSDYLQLAEQEQKRITVGISLEPKRNFNERSVSEHVSKMFELNNTELHFTFWFAIDSADLSETDIEPLIDPLLKHNGVSLLNNIVYDSAGQTLASIQVKSHKRGALVGDLIKMADAIGQLLLQVRSHHLTAEAALSFVRAGRADLLIGLPESSWLDAKRQGYNLSVDEGVIELAQDIARFANGSEAGLLVIGLATKKQPGLEIINEIVLTPERYDCARYQRAIDRRVFPPIEGLIIEDAKSTKPNGKTGHILAIFVPQQPEEAKPVLVHGAIIGSKVEGAFISIIQRRGEGSQPVSPQAIHSTLAAGRALLRRGELPSDNPPSQS